MLVDHLHSYPSGSHNLISFKSRLRGVKRPPHCFTTSPYSSSGAFLSVPNRRGHFLTASQITQAASGDAFERLISRTIFWSYCVVTPPSVIVIVVIGLLLSKL